MHTVVHRSRLAAPAAALFAALAIAGPAAATTATTTVGVPVSGPTTAGPTTQGIIMRDGGICDPIRHMGC